MHAATLINTTHSLQYQLIIIINVSGQLPGQKKLGLEQENVKIEERNSHIEGRDLDSSVNSSVSLFLSPTRCSYKHHTHGADYLVKETVTHKIWY